jgi:predicted peptidase
MNSSSFVQDENRPSCCRMAVCFGLFSAFVLAIMSPGIMGCRTTRHVGARAQYKEGVATGFINKTMQVRGETRRYVVYVPFEYTPEKPWPLILFLHGVGESGDDGLLQTTVGIGPAIRRHPELFPCLVVMPQCPKGKFYDSIIEDLETCLEQTRKEYNVDPKRMYLTGLSMGGYGTWIWGATKTDTFAALMPVCGGGVMLDMQLFIGAGSEEPFGTFEERVKRLATVPIWAFHGAKDTTVPPSRSQQMVKVVREAGGNVKYTEFPDMAHNAWDKVYPDPEVMQWLLSQHK